MYWGVGDIVSYSQLLAVLGFGSYFAATGAISLGDLLIFISYTLTLMWPVRALGRVLSEMSKAGVSLKRIKEILDAPAETVDPNAVMPPMNRDIEFKNVTFSYDTQPVLNNISFTVKSGTTFGILGATGSGKSTITYLLNRLYDLPDEPGVFGEKSGESQIRSDAPPGGSGDLAGGTGEITIGGVNIKSIDKSYLRKNVGLVLQEPFLFSKTLFENLDIASRKGDLAKVREKTAIAALDENIMTFAKGYDTIVGERGMTLSGGQKQRVAIARTLMLEAPIMIFDDSMSSLDTETDAKIRNALHSGTAGSTVILISHRISTLMTADVIMVLENGEVSEIGTHSELVEKNGHYRRVYDLQSGISNTSAL
jgi:ATP-binding cassette subfamily B protein